MIITTRHIKTFASYALVLMLAVITAWGSHAGGINFPVLLLAGALAISVIYAISVNIRFGFYLLMIANFFSVGLTRYVPLPLGLAIDAILVLLFVMYFFQHFRNINWRPLHNPAFYAIAIWMLINVVYIVNPEAHSFAAWFYAMRGVALYMFLAALMGYLVLEHKKDFNWFIHSWFICSLIGTFWGLKQKFIGLDGAENTWLSVPGNLSTHVLFGKLRIFSFYSDAGQFGASQAHTALVAIIMGVHEKIKGRKIFYFFTGTLAFYGMLISGTRGAIAIPLVGFIVYFFMIRNWRILMIGGILLFSAVYILKYTFIGQNVYEIRRMRTAMDPNDASLQVRLENQRKLGVYLHSHPFGGGIGSAGYWGNRFSPGTFLANLALDSWYVRIAAEYGYVGLVIYVAILLFIAIRAYLRIRAEQDERTRFQLIALFCGLAGVMVASYGNQVFGQLPTAIIIYLSIVLLTKKDPENADEKITGKL